MLFRSAAAALLGLCRALMPAHGAVDPLAYHLALPAIYLSKHYLSFERTLTGALYPDNVGMLYLLALGVRGASLAQLVHWFMGMTTVVAVWCFCRSYFNSRVGIFAAAFYAFTPAYVFFSSLAYVDVGVALFQFLGIWALGKWLRDGSRRSLALASVFMGLAMGSKHTALFLALSFAVIICVVLIVRKESPRTILETLALYGGVSVALAAPWYTRALIEASNPVWPVANELFNGLPYGSSFSISNDIGRESRTVDYDRIKELFYLSYASLWEWAWNGQLGWQRATGIHFVVLLPVALCHWGVRRVRWIAVAAVAYYLLVVLYIDGNPRYSLALFALLSVLAGWAAERLCKPGTPILGYPFKTVFIVSFGFNLAHIFALSYPSINYAFSGQASEQYLQEKEGNYRAFNFVNQQLPADSKVLLQGIVKGFYCEREYLWDHPYQKVLQYSNHVSAESLSGRMAELGVTHIVRMINIPPSRLSLGYPQYFTDPLQEDFRKKYLKLLYRDGGYVVFEVLYPS